MSLAAFAEGEQFAELLLVDDLFLQGQPQEVVDFAAVGGGGRQHVDLVLPLDHDLEGGDELEGLAVDLQRDDLVVAAGGQPDDLPLPDLEGLVHADLHLPHVQHVSQADHLDHSVAETLLAEVPLRVCLPQSGDSAAPVVDVEQDDVLVLFDADGDVVDGHGEETGESQTAVFEEVDGADLSVDQFVAELGEEQLRVLLADVVEVFADFGVQTDTDVVVDCKLTVFLPAYG